MVPVTNDSKMMRIRTFDCPFERCFPLLFIWSIGVLLLFTVGTGFAQQKEGIRIAHLPAAADAIPLPGYSLPLRIALLNTKETELSVKIFATIDGTLSVFNMENNLLDQYDRPTFSISLPAPVKRISYFFVVGSKPTPTISKTYNSQRVCAPATDIPEGELNQNQPITELVTQLSERSTILDGHVQALSQSIELLQKLKRLVSE